MTVKQGPTFASQLRIAHTRARIDREKSHADPKVGCPFRQIDKERYPYVSIPSCSGSITVKDIWSRDGRQARQTDWHLRGFDSSGRGGTRTFASKRPEVHAVFGEGRDDGEKKQRKRFQLTKNTSKFPASLSPKRFSLTWSDRNRRQLQGGSRETEKYLKTDFTYGNMDRRRIQQLGAQTETSPPFWSCFSSLTSPSFLSHYLLSRSLPSSHLLSSSVSSRV